MITAIKKNIHFPDMSPRKHATWRKNMIIMLKLGPRKKIAIV